MEIGGKANLASPGRGGGRGEREVGPRTVIKLDHHAIFGENINAFPLQGKFLKLPDNKVGWGRKASQIAITIGLSPIWV